MNPSDILRDLWQAAGLSADALAFAALRGPDPVFPSSFRVVAAAQSTIAAAALAACEVAHQRGTARQRVTVDMTHAAIECTGWFSIDGRAPDVWDAVSGLYRCVDGHVRIYANFPHHREGALRLLGLNPATSHRSDAERSSSSLARNRLRERHCQHESCGHRIALFR